MRLDRIDEALVERYIVWRRRTVSATSVNRELATLRRLLNVAKRSRRSSGPFRRSNCFLASANVISFSAIRKNSAIWLRLPNR
jgi:hypothetical protein